MTEINAIIKQLLDGKKFNSPQTLGVLSIKGPEAKDFLQRMSTADLKNLEATQSTTTCFLNKNGRLVDRVLVAAQGSDEFLLISSFSENSRLEEWLSNFHFIEDFSIERHEAKASLVLTWTDYCPPLCLWQSVMKGSFSLKIAVQFDDADYPILDQKSFETLRVASSMPWAHYEISEQFMPQNVGLSGDISADKGCYIGQEVIAKAITYQKNPKRLAGVKLSESAWQQLKIGTRVSEEQGLSGQILSKAPYFVNGLINALAICEQNSEPSEVLGQFIFN